MRTILAFALLIAIVKVASRRTCGNRHWMPFEYGLGLFVCNLERGHRGDHAGWVQR